MSGPRGYDWTAAGQRIRLTRLALGITEQEAADVYGVTLRTFRGYEQGSPQRAGFLHFAERYDVSIDWLVRGSTQNLGRHLSKLTRGKVAILKPGAPAARPKSSASS